MRIDRLSEGTILQPLDPGLRDQVSKVPLQGSLEYISTVVTSSVLVLDALSVLELLVEAGNVVDVALVVVGVIAAALSLFKYFLLVIICRLWTKHKKSLTSGYYYYSGRSGCPLRLLQRPPQ